MKHINQRRYPNIPYPTYMDFPDDPKGKNCTVRSSGCGLCSACMVVDQLTTQEFSVRDSLALSVACGGNHSSGTDMKFFAPAVAEKFDLALSTTNDVFEAVDAIRDGGRVIAHVSDKTEGNKGIFTRGGHYIVVFAATRGEVCILDPSWTSKKFVKWEKEGLVRTEGTLVYTTPEVLDGETKKTGIRYYIFRRKGAQ